MADTDEFDNVRSDPDPLRRGQRSTKLARLSKAAIEEAHRELGMSYIEIAEAIGLTKSRVGQIRTAGARERDRVLVHIAGVHRIGSRGAADYLTSRLTDLFAELPAGPYRW